MVPAGPNRGRQRRAQRSCASPLHAGLGLGGRSPCCPYFGDSLADSCHFAVREDVALRLVAGEAAESDVVERVITCRVEAIDADGVYRQLDLGHEGYGWKFRISYAAVATRPWSFAYPREKLHAREGDSWCVGALSLSLGIGRDVVEALAVFTAPHLAG